MKTETKDEQNSPGDNGLVGLCIFIMLVSALDGRLQ